MKHLFLCLLLLPFLSFTPADWLTVTLDQDASIDFFSEPTIQDFKSNHVWTNDIEDKARCIVSTTDLSKMGMDSASVANETPKESFMISLGNGILKKMPESKFISQKITATSGHLSYEFLINTGENAAAQFNRLYCTVIFYKAKMYTLYFYESANKPQKEYRSTFLNSFKIK